MQKLKRIYEAVGFSRLIIVIFLSILLLLTFALNLDSAGIASDVLVRIGLNSFFVLAMLPMVECGIGLNFALPLGILCGQFAGVLTVEWGITGIGGILAACFLGTILSAAVGFFYGKLLNHLRGSEMMVGTYINFSIVSLMCIGWMLFPFFSDSRIKWAMGNGVRSTITLDGFYDKVLNDFLAFQIGEVTVPTGLFLAFGLGCLAFWGFQKSKTGIMMKVSGMNPMFGKSIGINNDRMRIMGTILSTVCGAVGIVIYAQGIGMYQLYTAPRNMAFPAIAAILVGGATLKKANIWHVIIGLTLYQAILTVAPVVSASLIDDGSSLSEIARVIICNGVILYALTKIDGRKV